ncbi:MAG: YitT family protein [Clostridia bacterium]|nr:YitT family protein [Clostridia bacterium]
MKKIRSGKLFSKISELLMLVSGSLLIGGGVYFFKVPNGFSTGGISGISMIISKLRPGLSTGQLFTIINFALLILGFLVIGKSTGLKTVICSTLVSGSTWLFEILLPMDAPMTDQPFLELIYAVMMTGIGSALLFNSGASSGGTDIIALILKKYTKLDVGKALLCTDLIITLAAFPVFGMRSGLFSLLGLFSKAFLVDGIIENMNVCKSFMIVTKHPQEITDHIIRVMNHSATMVDAHGCYTGDDVKIIYTVCRRFEAAQLKKKIHEIDPDAFVIVESANEIIGRGFRAV